MRFSLALPVLALLLTFGSLVGALVTQPTFNVSNKYVETGT